MALLPKELKLTSHAKQRLFERKKEDGINYNTKNLMKSSCKWYGKDDLIPKSSLYIHCLYVCRKAQNKIGYLTNGSIEVLYNKNSKNIITILEVKDKFKPITQYIKPEYLKKIELKKEKKKMKTTKIGICPDCERENVELTMTAGQYHNLCSRCKTRKQNMRYRKKEYIPYKNLEEIEKNKIDAMVKAQENRREEESQNSEPIEIKVPDTEQYYQAKATKIPVPMKTIANVEPSTANVEPLIEKTFDPLSDQFSFIATLRECGCEIPKENLKEVLDILIATDKLKDIFMTIAKSDNQDAILDLEQALNVVERKLQHNWEFNGFQEIDDIKFKGFLTWRRVLKGAIFFWKKLYQTNTLIEMQRAWNSYTTDPNDKILMSRDRINSTQKRFQITTESISTIFNTKRPFTRVFYATSKEEAYDIFVKWMAERQLHENKEKTTIVELKNEGERVDEIK